MPCGPSTSSRAFLLSGDQLTDMGLLLASCNGPIERLNPIRLPLTGSSCCKPDDRMEDQLSNTVMMRNVGQRGNMNEGAHMLLSI